MEKSGLRKNALKAIDTVKWIPKWGARPIYGMVQHRPDGAFPASGRGELPITAMRCADCGEIVAPPEFLRRERPKLFEKHGADIWFDSEAKGLIPKTSSVRRVKDLHSSRN